MHIVNDYVRSPILDAFPHRYMHPRDTARYLSLCGFDSEVFDDGRVIADRRWQNPQFGFKGFVQGWVVPHVLPDGNRWINCFRLKTQAIEWLTPYGEGELIFRNGSSRFGGAGDDTKIKDLNWLRAGESPEWRKISMAANL